MSQAPHQFDLPSAAEPSPAAEVQRGRGAEEGSSRRAASRGRPDWLRLLALFAAALGATLAIIYSLFLANYSSFDSYMNVPASTYNQFLVPLLAVVALAGTFMLDRQPLTGMVLTLVGTMLGLAGGARYMVPGTVLACAWASRHDRLSRSVLGFLLLIPGVVAGFYAMAAVLSFIGGDALPGTPISLAHPVSLADALSPLWLLPLALVGAWLLAPSRTSHNP